MKKLLLALICLNLSLTAAIGDGMRIDASNCPCIEYNDCNGYCC